MFADLSTDENSLNGICNSHFWEFLNEVIKRWPCLLDSFKKILYSSQFDVQNG